MGLENALNNLTGEVFQDKLKDGGLGFLPYSTNFHKTNLETLAPKPSK